MKIEIKMEFGGWPTAKTAQCRPESELTAFIESMIRDGLLPSVMDASGEMPKEYSDEVKSVYVIQRGDTEEEIASYHPLLRKIIPLTERKKMKDLFGSADGKMRITSVSMEERKEQIAAKVTARETAERENTGAGAKWWKMNADAVMSPDEPDKEQEKLPETPYDKEDMLLDLAMGIMGSDQHAGKGAGASLWFYLLGFVLVCAFMVRTLIAMINYDPMATSFPIYTPIIVNALTMLLPASLCFIGGKIADSVAEKKKNKD